MLEISDVTAEHHLRRNAVRDWLRAYYFVPKYGYGIVSTDGPTKIAARILSYDPNADGIQQQYQKSIRGIFSETFFYYLAQMLMGDYYSFNLKSADTFDDNQSPYYVLDTTTSERDGWGWDITIQGGEYTLIGAIDLKCGPSHLRVISPKQNVAPYVAPEFQVVVLPFMPEQVGMPDIIAKFKSGQLPLQSPRDHLADKLSSGELGGCLRQLSTYTNTLLNKHCIRSDLLGIFLQDFHSRVSNYC